MEQNNYIKQELQQELRNLQQEIEQHSTFNTEVWQSSVKRYTLSLYRQNILCVVFLILIMGASLGVLYFGAHWPWWLVVPYILFFSVMVVDNLVVTRGMARPDVGSKDGLRSLRASVQTSNTMKRWRKWFYQGFGTLIGLASYIYLWFNDHVLFFSVLFAGIICLPIGYISAKRVKKRYEELGEEIDELLKEE